MVNIVFQNYPLDISDLFSISNTRSLDSLLANPYHLSTEERINLIIGIAISSLIAILLFICQYFLSSRCKIPLFKFPTTRIFKCKAPKAQELSEKPDHIEVTQRFQTEYVPSYSPSYNTDAQAPDYPLDLSKAPDYPID